MQFSQVAGQQKVKEKLINAVKGGRIPHAQLYYGPEGCGNLPLAIAYAQYIACLNRGEDDSCGTCSSCVKFAKLAHPDLHFSFPFNATKRINKALDKIVSDEFIAEWREKVLQTPYFTEKDWYLHIGIENKQGIIGKSEGDNIARKLQYKSYESEYKYMIIWLPEYMNTRAANSLLKLVEEPPSKTIFLFVSDNVNEVLPTIFSRTQPIKLNPIDNESLAASINKTGTADKTIIDSIVKIASGNYIKALQLMDQSEQTAAFLGRFKDMMRLAWKRDMASILSWIDELNTTGREQIKNFLEYALHMIRENFMMHTNNEGVMHMTQNENEFSANFNKFINGRNVIPLTRELTTAYNDVSRNGNTKIILTDTVLKVARLLRK